MRVEPATLSDVDSIASAYANARAIQQRHAAETWPAFPETMIRQEIDDGRLYRVVDGDEVAGFFSVAYEDPAIWGDYETGDHIYLHRIARTPTYRGRGIGGAIIEWARDHARMNGRAGLRLDTWASNPKMVAYYTALGFRLIEVRRLGADPRLPRHYHNLELALMESVDVRKEGASGIQGS